MKMKLVLAMTLLLASATSAQTKIRCNEDFQQVNGSEISTPYCRDNYLAEIARYYGIRVSNAEIRNNPGRKSEVCRMIGHDIRVQSACSSERGRGRR